MGILSQVHLCGKMGDSRLKAYLHLSVKAEGFTRRERGTERRGHRRACKVLYVQMSTVHSDKAGDGPVCVTLASRHPGFTPSWLYLTLAPRLKVSKSPRAGVTEGWSLSFEVSSQDSYTNMLFLWKLHISQSQHLQKQCPENGGVCYNALLQLSTVTKSLSPWTEWVYFSLNQK